MEKLVCGFGVNDVDYVVQDRNRKTNGDVTVKLCPYYRKWQNMLERCYSGRESYNTYAECEVCEEWRYLSKFKSWMETQDWQGMYLDKDLLSDGRLYSPNTCCFIDNQTNVFIRDVVKSKQGLSMGVCKNNSPKQTDNSYQVYIQDITLKKRLHLGYSNTENRGSDIHGMYASYFGDILADRYEDFTVKKALGNLSKYCRRTTPPYLKEFEKKVLVFNKTFGNSVEDKDLIAVYKNLTEEEITGRLELMSSYLDSDWEGVIDGLCDTLFTGLMWLNLQSVVLPDQYLDTTNIKGLTKYDIKLLHKSLEENRLDYFQRCLITITRKLSFIADIEKSFERVYLANMSKAISKLQDPYSEDTIKREIEESGRYEDVFIEDTGEYYIVKAKKDKQEGKFYPSGKIMKGSWYSSVEDLGGLSEFIYD